MNLGELVGPGHSSSDFSPLVQNGSVHQKDGLNDDDFEPYLSPQARPVSS